MTENPEHRHPESEPITDVTRWGLVGDLQSYFSRGKEIEIRSGAYRLRFDSDSREAVATQGRRKGEVFHLYLEGIGSDAKVWESRGEDKSRRVLVNESCGQWYREIIEAAERSETR